MHFVQILTRLPLIFLVCKFILLVVLVLILEWLLEKLAVVPLPHIAHTLAIVLIG